MVASAIAVALVSIPYVLASEVEQPVVQQEIRWGLDLKNAVELKKEEPLTTVKRPWQLKEIARCESGDTHYRKDGSVIRGKVNPQDIGRYQINLKYHGETAVKMGLDLFNEQDNEAYAMYLWNTQGAKPWVHSNNCHRLLG